MFSTLAETELQWVGDDEHGKCLILFVHGMNGQNNRKKIEYLIRAPEAWLSGDQLEGLKLDEIKSAALLMPTYNCRKISSVDPFALAADLQWLIYEVVKKYNFDRVILCGHSMGAVLIRKATVYGLGQLEDHPQPDLGQERSWTWAETRNGKPSALTGLVLLAGINRGWSSYPRPKHRSLLKHCQFGVGTTLARISPGIGRLFMSIERGSPFIANLRVQWIRLTRDTKITIPPITQLLGTIDDLVTDEDNRDVLVAKNFKFVSIPFSGHASILDLDDETEMVNGEPINRLRAQSILSALSGSGEHDRFDDTHSQQEKIVNVEAQHLSSGSKTKQVAFLMHGIRDNSDWPRRLREEIQFLEKGSRSEGKTYCVVSSYGHFSMAKFLLFPFRQGNVRWFMDQYTEAIAASEMDEEVVHFVGHSNGTYLLAQALQNYSTLKVDRVAFIGSVVPRGFPWDEYFRAGKVKKFRNDRAEDDWVVGIVPGFFQLLGKLIPISVFKDIGNGGLRGFDNSAGPDHRENYYFEGGHGAPTRGKNLKTLAEFVTTGKDRSRDDLKLDPKPLTDLMSNLNWLTLTVGLIVFLYVIPCVVLVFPFMLNFYQQLGWEHTYVQIGYYLLFLGVITTI